MNVLGIESSCDETSAAVIVDGRRVLSNVVASQTELHAAYGGVVPEVASRQHVVWFVPVLQRALQEAKLDWGDLDGIAVTNGPGLAGSLLVGVNMAKGLSLALGIPLVGVNHLEGHLYANWLSEEEPKFPHVALIVSGGHSDLLLVKGHRKFTLLGKTRDDAAGEAFDKVARILGLGYPGGPAIQQAAEKGDPSKVKFPRAWLGRSYDFSFSGLKTAVLRLAERRQEALAGLPAQARGLTPASAREPSLGPGNDLVCPAPASRESTDVTELSLADIAASFQEAVIDVLVEKTRRAAAAHKVKMVLLAGGVAANQRLREELTRRLDLPVKYPPIALCTDNAAMIASAGYFRLQAGQRDALDLDVVPNLPLAPGL